MAANCARRTVLVSSASAKTLLSCSQSPSPFAFRASKFSGLPASKPNSASSRLSVPKLNFSRLPVELASLQSLMPLHSATASALSTSLLSLHNDKWGCLSEEGVRYDVDFAFFDLGFYQAWYYFGGGLSEFEISHARIRNILVPLHLLLKLCCTCTFSDVSCSYLILRRVCNTTITWPMSSSFRYKPDHNGGGFCVVPSSQLKMKLV
ncbi:hypothetical protein FNV43_RR26011 [Rhamnella rubrinervis]|uniref:Uncharacterized protein n=1 Tax=Rhamnella rubrinervis TaxID=2594499 RepID=A0A8K0DM55_9ROSA|nr:hypothetical protein FNV43_RR26011 [Rhamnella rubrinervis]